MAAAGCGSVSCLSRCGRRCGGGCAMDFWASSSSATWRRPLQRHREEGGRCAGATTPGHSGLAVAWKVSWFVLGWWSAAGRSGASPRRHRPEWPDLEDEGELGAGPRPACHSDMWALRCSFWWFTKPFLAMELLLPRVCWSLLLPLAVLRRRRRAAGSGWCCRVLQRLGCFFIFLWRLFCKLYGPTCPFGPFLRCVRVLYSVLSSDIVYT